MTELEKARLPLLEARKKAEGSSAKTKEAQIEKLNKQLRMLNLAVQAGCSTEKEMKAWAKDNEAGVKRAEALLK